MTWHTLSVSNSTGWPFMVAGVMLGLAIRVAPVVYQQWQDKRPLYPDAFSMLLAETELRMMVGWMLSAIGLAVFAGVGWWRSVIVEGGDLRALFEFTRWARTWFAIPSSILVVVGNTMVLWDGLDRLRMACLLLTSLAVFLWLVGGVLGDWLAWALYTPMPF